MLLSLYLDKITNSFFRAEPRHRYLYDGRAEGLEVPSSQRVPFFIRQLGKACCQISFRDVPLRVESEMQEPAKPLADPELPGERKEDQGAHNDVDEPGKPIPGRPEL